MPPIRLAAMAVVLMALPARAAAPQTASAAEFLAAIPAQWRSAVAAIVTKPTLIARSEETPFLARPDDYDFLTAHPDRASLVWRRLNVPCVTIKEIAGGEYLWQDEAGNRITWRPVARFSDGVVWLAGGQIKAGSVLPSVPVSAVAVLRCPRTPLAGDPGMASFEPSAVIYLQTDSRAANTFLRIAGPAVPRLAEQGAEQMLLFFSGPARYVRQNPEELPELFGPAKR